MDFDDFPLVIFIEDILDLIMNLSAVLVSLTIFDKMFAIPDKYPISMDYLVG